MRTFLATLFSILTAWVAPPSASAQLAPPSYTVQYLGNGGPVAINDSATVVGVRTNSTTGTQTPLVSFEGAAWQALPIPSGATGAFPTAINDADVIAGVAIFPTGRRAVRWLPSGGSFVVELIPLLPGELANYATGINNRGQIVGARAGILGTPFGFGWLHSDADGLVDLNARYGWFATPNDINDAGVILSGTQTFDLATRTLSDVGLTGPANYNAVGGVALNESGQIAGQASLRSTSLNIVSVFRFTPGSGWLFIRGTSRFTLASSINDLGDVGHSEQGPAVYFEGIGEYALGDLIAPSDRAAGWLATGLSPEINDARVIAVTGRNTLTGASGGLLLTPVGNVVPPAAPTNLTATPHPATVAEPWVSIDLSWQNADPVATRSYELERTLAGQANWTQIPLVPPAFSTFHQDTTVAVATTYDYRVRAVGVVGPGPWSAIATATSPSTPLDDTPPVVALTSPANGATVSGAVTVSAAATDDVAVASLELSYFDSSTGSWVEIASAANTGTISATWDTSVLSPGTFTVRALAIDSLGNFAVATADVEVVTGGTPMRVSNINLSAALRSGVLTVTGAIRVRSASGARVPDALVEVRWILPTGATTTATARTNAEGRASVTTSGPRGRYTLTVTNVTKSGFAFDAGSSVLSRSITR